MKILIKVPKKSRAHFVLFSKDTPFKPKVVKSKKIYNRSQKNKDERIDCYNESMKYF
jgi:hypothetical protein